LQRSGETLVKNGQVIGLHRSVFDFIKKVIDERWDSSYARVLELGSKEDYPDGYSGPRVKAAFPEGINYTGIDITDGLGVDMIMNANDLQYDDGSFDVVVSSEMLEHDHHPHKSMSEAIRVLRKGGLLIVAAAAPNMNPHYVEGSNVHTPGPRECYCNISKDLLTVWMKGLVPQKIWYERDNKDVFAWGVKR